MVWGGKWEGVSGLGTRVHPWWIRVCMVKSMQYCKVKLKKRINVFVELLFLIETKWKLCLLTKTI